jgi:peptide/nickel transport system substrate-binding protein
MTVSSQWRSEWRAAGPSHAVARLLLVTIVLISACSGGGGGGGGGAPNAKAVLRYGYDFSSQFTNLDPGKSTGDCDAIAIAPIFDTLIHKDLGDNLLPGQAASWELGDTTLTLHLRPGITFSDGEAFDANAVKLGVQHLQKDTTYSDLATVTAIDVLDPLTVKITLKDTPPIELLYAMTGREGMIVAPKSLDTASTHPVGAGPFTFQSFAAGASLSMRTNPTYWDKGAYKFGGIDFTQVGVGPPSVTALKSGAVDMVALQPDSYNGLKTDHSIGIGVQNTPAYLQFQFRFTPPFDKVEVRKAVEFAIDRSQINQVVQDGLGEVANQSFYKASSGYNPAVAGLYSFNPASAHQLLVQSGLPLPIHIDMVIPGGNIASMENQGAIIQQELNAVGFSVSVKRILGSDIEAGYYLSGSGNGFAAERPGEPYPPIQIYDQWGSNQFVAIWSKGERADLTSMILAALKATDTNQARQLTQQAEAIVMQQALDVPIAFAPQLMGYTTSTVGGAVHGQTGVCDAPDLTGVLVKR